MLPHIPLQYFLPYISGCTLKTIFFIWWQFCDIFLKWTKNYSFPNTINWNLFFFCSQLGAIKKPTSHSVLLAVCITAIGFALQTWQLWSILFCAIPIKKRRKMVLMIYATLSSIFLTAGNLHFKNNWILSAYNFFCCWNFCIFIGLHPFLKIFFF